MVVEKNVINNIFSKRMSDLFDLRVENDKEILEGLAGLSLFFQSNTLESRRNFKSLIEDRMIKINKNFLNSFKTMKSSFENVSKGINEMNSALIDMKKSLATTKDKTKALIEKTLEIQEEVNLVSVRKDIVSAVIDRLQLNSYEVSVLRSSEISSEIFSVLDKSERIIAHCKTCLEREKNILAQDILEQMIIYHDTGMERLYKWTRNKCSACETTVLSLLLPQAMAKLQNKCNLFDQILEEISANRSIALVRHFIDALTLGGRPIEHRVTEPRRYVGDMLAWLHQALPAEMEYLNFLLKNCDNSDDYVLQMLRKITEGCCHPLRVRIEHVLLGEENSQDSVLLQDIYILLKDYNEILSQIISNSRLNATFVELMEVAEKTLLLSLQNKISALLSSDREGASGNLYPAESTEKIVAFLVQILTANPSSLINENHVSKKVGCAIDPLMIRITESASKLPVVEMAIYLLNNFHFIETSLALYPFLDDRLERLKAQCDAQIDTLTSEQASALVSQLSLGPIYTALQRNTDKPFSLVYAMEPSKISGMSVKLQKFLMCPKSYQLPQLALLSSAVHRSAIQKHSLAVIASIYEKLYQAVFDPKNEYKSPSEILPIPPETVQKAFKNSVTEISKEHIEHQFQESSNKNDEK